MSASIDHFEPGNQKAAPSPPGEILLLVNGLLLGLTAGVQALFDLAGYFLNLGPLAAALYRQPDAIGFFEAHGLALIVAILLCANRREASWHWVAVAFHALLGAANLMFWPVFVQHGLVPMGIVATAAHAAFFALELAAALIRTPRLLGGPGTLFRLSALVTLATGMVLHASSLALGRETFVRILFTPLFDALFAIPMTIAGIAAIWLYRRAVFPAFWQRVVYIFVAFYFTASILIHLSTLVTWNTGYVLAFPAWYPLVALAMMIALFAFVVRQRFAPARAQ